MRINAFSHATDMCFKLVIARVLIINYSFYHYNYHYIHTVNVIVIIYHNHSSAGKLLDFIVQKDSVLDLENTLMCEYTLKGRANQPQSSKPISDYNLSI